MARTLIGEGAGGGAVEGGDGILGDVEAEAKLRLLVQEGHADGILVRLRIVCGRGSKPAAQSTLQAMADKTAGTLMTSGAARS